MWAWYWINIEAFIYESHIYLMTWWHFYSSGVFFFHYLYLNSLFYCAFRNVFEDMNYNRIDIKLKQETGQSQVQYMPF